MSDTTFKQFEHDIWQRKASTYDDGLAMVTRRMVGPILRRLGDISGLRLLDVASGTGHLAGEAARRGAHAEGLDLSEAMVEVASRNYPGVPFRVGDAEALPYPDGHFDVVTCAFGLLHLPDPERGITEAHRVLRPGGRYAFTVWCTPEQGHEFMGLVMGSIQEYGKPAEGHSNAPPMFRFADEDECRRVLTALGFDNVDVSSLPDTWRGSGPQDVIEMLSRSMVRAQMLLDAQTEEDRAIILQAIRDRAEQYRTPDGLEIRFMARLVVATRR